MSSAKPTPSRLRQLQFDGEFLWLAYRQEYLAGSPFSGTTLDTFLLDSDDAPPSAAFMFSDIPDASFREPQFVISMSHASGGLKS